jgi:hypothetical protein
VVRQKAKLPWDGGNFGQPRWRDVAGERLAGEGPLSDGVPRYIPSTLKIPEPPRQSRKIDERPDVDDTVRIRRKP